MPSELSIPEDLWQARDSAIEGFLSGKRDVAAEKQLEGWLLSADAYEQLVEGDDPIGMICDLRCSDDDVISQLGLDDDSEVSDRDRVEFARQAMDYARGNCCSTYIEARPITSSSGKKAYLGISSVAGGQGGMYFSWLGLYKGPQSLVEIYKEQGCAIDNMMIGERGFDDYTDDEIIRLTHL